MLKCQGSNARVLGMMQELERNSRLPYPDGGMKAERSELACPRSHPMSMTAVNSGVPTPGPAALTTRETSFGPYT